MKLYECFLSLFGGITVFITAMNIMSSNLQKIAGSKVKKILAKKASNILIYAGIGTIIAMVIQSSTAVTVMSIGFVNADMINLAQATTVILGANFGSSIIGILASLDSLNINIYFSFISFVGIVLTFFNKEKLKIIGGIISGLGMIFIGLNLMKTSCDHDSFKNVLRDTFEKIDFPLALIFIGLAVTAIIQSSSAMTGLIIVMVQGESMDMKSGLFIIIGAHIGTAATVIISTIGKSINARRTGIIYLIFKFFGTFVFTILVWIFNSDIIKILEKINKEPGMQLAWFNLFFKLITSLISFPLINVFVFISCKIIKGEKEKTEKKKWRKAFNHLNKRFLKVPSIAEEEIKKEIKDIIDLTKQNMEANILELLYQNNHFNEEIALRNDLLNSLNFESIKFLAKLSQPLNGKPSEEINNKFLLINHLIKINRNIRIISKISTSMKNKGVKFDENSINSLKNINKLFDELFSKAEKYNDNNNDNKKSGYLIISEKINYLGKNLFQENFMNIMSGKTSITIGLYLTSIITCFENICSNLEKIILIFKSEKISFKNKSFEQRNERNDYVLVVRHKDSMQTNSTSRNRLSIQSDSIKDVNTGAKIPNSKD